VLKLSAVNASYGALPSQSSGAGCCRKCESVPFCCLLELPT